MRCAATKRGGASLGFEGFKGGHDTLLPTFKTVKGGDSKGHFLMNVVDGV